MYEAKTTPTQVSVSAYLEQLDDASRRTDCQVLVAVMERVTGCAPQMWGPSIVGFDSYHYKYESGHEGDSCVVGFSPRKSELSIYLIAGYEAAETKALLARLGKHKTGKACLYVKRLVDIDLEVLEILVARSVAEVKRRYPAMKE